MPELKEQTIKLIYQMNDELGVYFPGDVHDEYELELYDELFTLLRQAFYLYSLINKSEIQELFIKFYNLDYGDKLGVINELKIKIQNFIESYQRVIDNNPELIEQRNALLYQIQPDRESKAELLYFLSKGYLPEDDSELSEYLAYVDAIEDAVSKVAEEITTDQQEELHDEDENNAVVERPEDVVSRYLKGSGIYDPALRNTGFRVDTDIENTRTKI